MISYTKNKSNQQIIEMLDLEGKIKEVEINLNDTKEKQQKRLGLRAIYEKLTTDKASAELFRLRRGNLW